MYQFIIRNLDKIFISFSGLVLFELTQKYYNLKNCKQYNNYYIKNEKIYHIDVYKKDNLNNFNKYNKYNKYNDINFINLPYLKNIKSISFVIKNDNYKIFNNVKYVKPQKFIYYNNDNIFETIVKMLNEKENIGDFYNLVKSNKNNNNIKYKISQNDKTFCLYLNDKLILISDNQNEILLKSIEDEIKYMFCSLIFAFFWIMYYPFTI